MLRSIMRVMTPPRVSMPRLSGVTSSSSTSLTSPLSTPACRLAPMATTSSGLTDWFGSLPPESSFTRSRTAGIRVEPPTRMIWSMSPTPVPPSLSTERKGSRQRSSRSWVRRWNSARVSDSSRWSGPAWLAVMYGMLMFVLVACDSSILAFSAASWRRCLAILSLPRSTPFLFLNWPMSQSTMRWSQSSPPRRASPLVAFTSKTPSEMSSSETSKVPPPRSKTRTVCSWSALSRP